MDVRLIGYHFNSYFPFHSQSNGQKNILKQLGGFIQRLRGDACDLIVHFYLGSEYTNPGYVHQ